MFQAGNSSLTLTVLSISAMEEKSRPSGQAPADHKSELETETAVEDSSADFPAIPENEFQAAAAPRLKNEKTPMDADARTKGVSGLLAESAGIRPYYPLGARLRGEEGIVKVEVCVDPRGEVLDCAVAESSGYTALDNAALKAVKHAHFVSAGLFALKNKHKTTLTFRFDLVD
jgi:protein TonB